MNKVSWFAVGCLFALVIGACGDDTVTQSATNGSTAVSSTTAAPTTAAPTTALPPLPTSTTAQVTPATRPQQTVGLSALTDHRLDFDRLGPVVIGMTPEQASAASGVEIREDERQRFPESGCGIAMPVDGDGVWMILRDGVIAAIHVGPRVVTVHGVGHGTPEGEIPAVYGADMVRVREHPYGGPEWHVLEVSSPEPGMADRLMVFDTDGSVVTEFRAGTIEAARLAEGCA